MSDDTPEVLIISVFGEEGSPERLTADEHFEIFKDAASFAGMKAIRLDKLDTERLRPRLWEKLKTCRVAIADFTVPNSNAAYELGIRHALQMPTIIVTRDPKKLPFDLGDLKVHQLQCDGTDAKKLARRLRQPIPETRSTVFKDWGFRVVPPPPRNTDVNVNFYDTIVEALRNSKENTLLVGSGFETDSKIMNEYLRVSVDYAMSRELERIDISSPETHEHWWKLMARYLLPMDNFTLWIPEKNSLDILIDVALFDFDSAQNSLVEIMFHTGVDRGGIRPRAMKRAGFSFFAHSHKLADDLRKILRELQSERRRALGNAIVEIRTLSELKIQFGLPDDWGAEEPNDSKELYFAYGTDMLQLQMETRAPNHRFICRAALQRHTLSTAIDSAVFSSPVVNAIREESSLPIHGVLYEVDGEDLKRLDFFNEVGKFQRQPIQVTETGGAMRSREAYTYMAPPSELEHVLSEFQMSNLVNAAEERGLPRQYIDTCIKPLG